MEQHHNRSGGPVAADASYASSETVEQGKAPAPATNDNDVNQVEGGGFWGWMAVFGGYV